MRKIYSLILLAIMAMMPQSMFAWSHDIPAENIVLDSVYGYSLYKYYDFFNGKYGPGEEEFFSDGQGNRVSGDGCLVLSPDKASFKLNGFDTFQVLQPVEMGNFYIQIGTGALNLRAGVGKDGIHNYGSGSRFFAIGDVKAGQIVVLQWGVTTSRASIVAPSAAISGADACTVVDITEEIHAAQIEAGTHFDWVYDETEEEDVWTEIPGTADNFTYWKMESDGYLVVEMQRDCCMQGLQIWIDASADEAVSAPTSKIIEVDGTSRKVEMTSGVSTLGAECSVWYGLESEEALFLIDTEEVIKADTTFVKDEEGNILYEEDGVTPKIDHIDYTYKKVLDPDEWQNGAGVAGPNTYYGSPIEISDQDDEDGDGYVVINAATVSAKGNFSDIVRIKVAVNELTLNAPTLTLVGLEGLTRKYTLGWTNNTLCGEEFEVYVTVDGTEQQYDLGATIEAEQTIAARAHVEGYNDGVLEEADVLARDMEYKRKNAEKAEAEQHDWDFVHLTETQYQMIRGEYSDTYVYTTPNEQNPEVMDSTFYTRDEYMAMLESGELQQGDAEPYNPIDCGWWYDASKSRATLNVVAPDSIFNEAGEFVELKINGKDANANGYGYVDDSYVQLFNNGLSFSCPPNANNASCLFIYTNGDLGAYFMARPTLTFARETAKYGDYVFIYQGAGGSNYTNSRWPALYEVPADDLLHVTLQSGGVHVFYIDIYSPAEAPEDPYTGIEEVQVPAALKDVIFDLSGRRVQKAEKGIFIINGKKVVK